MKMTLGTDPEFTFRKNGNIFSSPNVIKFSKAKPYKSNVAEIFSDNANVELNVPPASTKAEFIANIRQGLAEIKKVAKDFEIVALPSLEYPMDQMKHRICRVFGCEPDFNAWTIEENVIDTLSAKKSTFRSGGGHIHYGTPEESNFLKTFEGKIQFIKCLDATLGVPSMLVERNSTSAKLRRNLYGKAGAHRPKSYGVEYRSLSNWWLRDPEYASFIWDMSHVAKTMMVENLFTPKLHDPVRGIIDENDITAAEASWQYLSDTFPQINDKLQYICNLNVGEEENIYPRWGI